MYSKPVSQTDQLKDAQKLFQLSLTKEKNNKYYNHREEHSIPELCQSAPDPQVENTLPSATTNIQNDN